MGLILYTQKKLKGRKKMNTVNGTLQRICQKMGKSCQLLSKIKGDKEQELGTGTGYRNWIQELTQTNKRSQRN